MTCGICRKTQAAGVRPRCRGLQYVAACPAGDIPKLKQENKIFRDVFNGIKYGLIRQFDGGYDFNALALFFSANQVCPEFQAACLGMINIIISAREEVRAAERSKK